MVSYNGYIKQPLQREISNREIFFKGCKSHFFNNCFTEKSPLGATISSNFWQLSNPFLEHLWYLEVALL